MNRNVRLENGGVLCVTNLVVVDTMPVKNSVKFACL